MPDLTKLLQAKTLRAIDQTYVNCLSRHLIWVLQFWQSYDKGH